MEKYFLSSDENKQLEYVRECEYIRYIKFSTGKLAVIAKISEPVQWKDEKGFHGSDYVIITSRHEGYDIKNITYFPTFVYVTVLKNKDYDLIEEIVADDLITIGIGELYETYDRAENHIFD